MAQPLEIQMDSCYLSSQDKLYPLLPRLSEWPRQTPHGLAGEWGQPRGDMGPRDGVPLLGLALGSSTERSGALSQKSQTLIQ